MSTRHVIWAGSIATVVGLLLITTTVVRAQQPGERAGEIIRSLQRDRQAQAPSAAADAGVTRRRLGQVVQVPSRVDVTWAPKSFRSESGSAFYNIDWSDDRRLLVSDAMYAMEFCGVVPLIQGPFCIWGNPEASHTPEYLITARREAHGDSCNHLTIRRLEMTGAVRESALLIDSMELFHLEGVGASLSRGTALEICNDNALQQRLKRFNLPDQPLTEVSRRTMSGGLVENCGLYNYSGEPGQSIVRIRGCVTKIVFRNVWFASDGADVMRIEMTPQETWTAGKIDAARQRRDGARANIPEGIVIDDCLFEGSGILAGKPGVIRLGPGVPRSAVSVNPNCKWIEVVESAPAGQRPPNR